MHVLILLLSNETQGTENMARYANCKIRFLEIGNIHAMRGSVDALRDMCLSTQLPESNWLATLQVCLARAEHTHREGIVETCGKGGGSVHARWVRRVRVFFLNIFIYKFLE
jgi:hypothetical protein